jgi:nitrate/TMAO reductase-like tetraheme cytochrome c subunit
LEGQHKEVDCKSCHFEELATEENSLGQLFDGISTACATCHDNVHGDQFAKNGITDCTRCHSSEGWDAEFFNHDTTAFPLEGRHAEIDCNACHKQVFENGIEIIEYKIERFECIDCHS